MSKLGKRLIVAAREAVATARSEKMEIECPCCLGEGKIEEKSPVPLTKLQLKIFNIVRKSQFGIEGPMLTRQVYADRADGGPVTAADTVWHAIGHANQRLKAAGLRIKASARGPGSVYKLERTDGPQSPVLQSRRPSPRAHAGRA